MRNVRFANKYTHYLKKTEAKLSFFSLLPFFLASFYDFGLNLLTDK